ncbi:MAG: NAD-dependent deacetylase [Pseudomonadales bacterium]
MVDQARLERFAELIDRARNIVFFTGAGISTESGIPDFRSQGTGIWEKMKPIYFEEFLRSEDARLEQWRRKFAGDMKMEGAKPNKGHLAIAKLVEMGKCSAVITQNVDNLHQNAGVPDDRVIELHGNASYAVCLSCRLRYELADLKLQFERQARIDPCARCGGIIKTATISFGQAMPEDAMRRAHAATEDCDLMIATGSTLIVYPAAGFPEYAKQLGAKLAILNREATPLDPIADIVLHAEIGPTLSYLVGIN